MGRLWTPAAWRRGVPHLPIGQQTGPRLGSFPRPSKDGPTDQLRIAQKPGRLGQVMTFGAKACSALSWQLVYVIMFVRGWRPALQCKCCCQAGGSSPSSRTAAPSFVLKHHRATPGTRVLYCWVCCFAGLEVSTTLKTPPSCTRQPKDVLLFSKKPCSTGGSGPMRCAPDSPRPPTTLGRPTAQCMALDPQAVSPIRGCQPSGGVWSPELSCTLTINPLVNLWSAGWSHLFTPIFCPHARAFCLDQQQRGESPALRGACSEGGCWRPQDQKRVNTCATPAHKRPMPSVPTK